VLSEVIDMQKNELRDLATCAFAISIFVNVPLAAQTIKTGVAGNCLAMSKMTSERYGGKI
jgi:hypothetical protein